MAVRRVAAAARAGGGGRLGLRFSGGAAWALAEGLEALIRGPARRSPGRLRPKVGSDFF